MGDTKGKGKDDKVRTLQAGNYAAPVDTQGMDPEMLKTLRPPNPRPFVNDRTRTLNEKTGKFEEVPGLTKSEAKKLAPIRAQIKERHAEVERKRGERALRRAP